jgi:hypothetical protein
MSGGMRCGTTTKVVVRHQMVKYICGFSKSYVGSTQNHFFTGMILFFGQFWCLLFVQRNSKVLSLE